MHLGLLHLDVGSRVQVKQLNQNAGVHINLLLGSIWDFYKWVLGAVVDQTGPISYRVRFQGGGYGIDMQMTC